MQTNYNNHQVHLYFTINRQRARVHKNINKIPKTIMTTKPLTRHNLRQQK